ncbi:hypothetical protein ACX8Z9_09120 [Arthrobacter halodurans]|uniref:Uncharacterized protein n=1 Tax=Arthrobacter halodurans TaxID=516699 RepID=A0ABV4UQ14_9MICC
MSTLERLAENLRQALGSDVRTGFSPSEFGGDGAEFARIELPSCRFEVLPYTEYDFRIRIILQDGYTFFSGETWVPTDDSATQDRALVEGMSALVEAARNDVRRLIDDGLETRIGYVYFDPEPT